NCRRMEWRNPALMAQHPKSGAEQIDPDLAVRGGSWLYQDFIAISHEKAPRLRKVEQYFSPIGSRRHRLRDRRLADDDLLLRCRLVAAGRKPIEGKIRDNA